MNIVDLLMLIILTSSHVILSSYWCKYIIKNKKIQINVLYTITVILYLQYIQYIKDCIIVGIKTIHTIILKLFIIFTISIDAPQALFEDNNYYILYLYLVKVLMSVYICKEKRTILIKYKTRKDIQKTSKDNVENVFERRMT